MKYFKLQCLPIGPSINGATARISCTISLKLNKPKNHLEQKIKFLYLKNIPKSNRYFSTIPNMEELSLFFWN